MNFKAAVFDLDGTLTDPKEGITRCVSYALEHFGIKRDPDSLTCFIGPPLKEQFMKYAALSERDAVRAVEIYRERFAPIGLFENKIYGGILPMLEKLRSLGVVMAIATSKPKVFAVQIAEKYGIAPYMTEIVGSELDGTLTDKALVIKKAMELLKAGESAVHEFVLRPNDKEDIIMVGDREHDCIGAKKNGIGCIGVLYGYSEPGELRRARASKIVSDTDELCSALVGIIDGGQA